MITGSLLSLLFSVNLRNICVIITHLFHVYASHPVIFMSP